MAAFFLALGGVFASVAAYAWGAVPAWSCVLGVALCTSILHEIEHDLIHDLYFRQHPKVQHLLLLFGWLVRPNMINPWHRKILHLHHHRVSGTATDYEEMGATNGVPMGLRRLVMMTGGMTRRLLSRRRGVPRRKIVLEGVEIGHGWRNAPEIVFEILVYAWGLSSLARLGATHAGLEPTGTVAAMMRGLDFVSVTLLLPNLLRRFCLVFMTSNNHFHGDVKHLMEQTQVLDHWIFLPFNVFCFNFGATHAIHHFVVKQPFYLRQWLARDAFRVMKDNGVRFNDFGTFLRANRFARTAPSAE